VLRRVFDQHVQVVCFAVAGEQPAAHFVEDVQRVIRQPVECSPIANPSSVFVMHTKRTTSLETLCFSHRKPCIVAQTK
jgi:hypothetical protein